MNEVRVLTAAFRFACERHADQRRKGASAEPYVNHLAEVADRVAVATGGQDVNLVVAAMLHDAVEDAGVTRAELTEMFGEDVAALVSEVTDDKSLEKAERKRLQIINAPKKSARAKMLKLADKTSNLRAIIDSPPDWPDARKLEYGDWAEAVAAGLRGVNARLESEFDAALAALRARHRPERPSDEPAARAGRSD